jgi:hypothetical protein
MGRLPHREPDPAAASAALCNAMPPDALVPVVLMVLDLLHRVAHVSGALLLLASACSSETKVPAPAARVQPLPIASSSGPVLVATPGPASGAPVKDPTAATGPARALEPRAATGRTPTPQASTGWPLLDKRCPPGFVHTLAYVFRNLNSVGHRAIGSFHDDCARDCSDNGGHEESGTCARIAAIFDKRCGPGFLPNADYLSRKMRESNSGSRSYGVRPRTVRSHSEDCDKECGPSIGGCPAGWGCRPFDYDGKHNVCKYTGPIGGGEGN